MALRLCVSSAFPLAWPESLNGLFRTPLRGPAPPPPFVRWLARVSAGGLRSAKSGGAGRCASYGCYLLHFCRKMFLRVRVVGWRGEQELRFLFAARVRRAGFPGTDSPRRVDSPAAGGSPSKSCSGRGLAAAPRRLSPRSPRLLALGPGLGVRSQWKSRGRSRGAQAASGRDPSRRVARKPGGNSFFPHSAPRGCRRGKRRRRREDRPRQGEEAPRLVSPSPGRQVRKVGIKNSCTRRTRWAGGGGGLPVEQTGFADRDLFILDEYTNLFGSVEARLVLLVFKSLALPGTTLREVWAARSPPAFYRSFGEHSWSAKSCWRATVSRG